MVMITKKVPPKPADDKRVKVNLGCGVFKLNGFINIDSDPRVFPDLCEDVRCLPFREDSIDELYAGHMLEHLIITEALPVLRHWHLKLKKGGRLTITIPDFDLIWKQRSFEDANLMLMRPQEMFSEGPHRSLWTIRKVVEYLKEIGFRKIKVIKDCPYLVNKEKWQSIVEAYK